MTGRRLLEMLSRLDAEDLDKKVFAANTYDERFFELCSMSYGGGEHITLFPDDETEVGA